MCPSSSKSPKPQSAKSQQPEPDQSYDPSSFSDTFRAMARESLVKNLIPLVLILVLMWVRYTMQRQALNDFAELEAARTAWKKTRDRQYLELMAVQSARILEENKALTKQARAHVQEYADFAAQKLGAQR